MYAASLLHNGKAPDSLEICENWLMDQPESADFIACRDCLCRLTRHVDKAWEWIRQLEEQLTHLTFEPERAHSGIEGMLYDLLCEDIHQSEEAGYELETLLRDMMAAPLPEFYRKSRVLPLEAARNRIQHHPLLSPSVSKPVPDDGLSTPTPPTPLMKPKTKYFPKNGMSRKGFTLIEMLVVIAIISMLMLLVVPAAGSVQKRAKRSACASNLRQIAMASLMYSAEHGGKLVATPFKDPNVYWFRQMYPYLKRDNENKTTRVFQCMEDRDALEAFHNQGTEWNSISYLLLKESPEWSYLSEIRSPSQSPQFIDAEITATADYGTPA